MMDPFEAKRRAMLDEISKMKADNKNKKSGGRFIPTKAAPSTASVAPHQKKTIGIYSKQHLFTTTMSNMVARFGIIHSYTSTTAAIDESGDIGIEVMIIDLDGADGIREGMEVYRNLKTTMPDITFIFCVKDRYSDTVELVTSAGEHVLPKPVSSVDLAAILNR